MLNWNVVSKQLIYRNMKKKHHAPHSIPSWVFSLIWLARYTERMGVRVCSCCGNGLLFVKGYIPGIWCVCAAIDKTAPILQGLMNGPRFSPGQAGGLGGGQESGGGCASWRMPGLKLDRGAGGDVCGAADEPGREEVSAVRRRRRASSRSFFCLIPAILLSVTHFAVRIRYVSVCVLVIALLWQGLRF